MGDLVVAKRIEEGMDRRGVAYTTYQMRNCFRQFADGVATELDVHCYLQHAAAADLCRRGARVLDVCCGRGLLLPFLRYRLAAPSVYVGVDAEPANCKWRDGADPRRESDQKKNGWGFPVLFVRSTVDVMTGAVREVAGREPFDLIVYTSAIEHMQPDAQRASLERCFELAASGARLYLTCPVTQNGRSGYEAQYAAHVYEPTKNEIEAWLLSAGWRVVRTSGLCTGARAFRERLGGSELALAEALYADMPREFALVLIAAVFPGCAQEMAYVCERADETLF